MATVSENIESQPDSVTDAASADIQGEALDALIKDAREALLARQREDGHWVYELEADATIPAEYIMLLHYLGEEAPETEARLANYLRAIQGDDGGWPLFHAGEMDLSATVKAYFALKLAGDDPSAAHMARAREVILAAGGAARANVFTRIALALFGEVPWRAVPVMPVEIMLLPRWFPFHLEKVSYWSRTVIVPLLILMALKPRARNPGDINIRELFATPPDEERHYLRSATDRPLARLFLGLDRLLRLAEPHMPKRPRARAIEAALNFTRERLNGEDGLGAIFPAMANAVMAFEALGYAPDHPDRAIARQAIDKLLVFHDDWGYCQPCVSPIWDTALAAHALMESGVEPEQPEMQSALSWLRDLQILDVKGDWTARRPDLRPGGWAFQYRNDFYPDVDDTAVVGMALDRAVRGRTDTAVDRAVEWIDGMQSGDGGWGAFDPENTHHYLNHIPFADHGALLDPPTEDVTARCLSLLAQRGRNRTDPVVARALAYLKRTQQPDGSWFGRWGTNYIYGTWSVLSALNAAGDDPRAPYIRKAVDWLKSRQRADGGWGEDGASYWDDRKDVVKDSTPSQTAWALLGLMAAGETHSAEVAAGIRYLMRARRDGDKWHETLFTAVGFPRVFYLRYHGYSAYFPLWALARYRNLTRSNRSATPYGM